MNAKSYVWTVGAVLTALTVAWAARRLFPQLFTKATAAVPSVY